VCWGFSWKGGRATPSIWGKKTPTAFSGFFSGKDPGTARSFEKSQKKRKIIRVRPDLYRDHAIPKDLSWVQETKQDVAVMFGGEGGGGKYRIREYNPTWVWGRRGRTLGSIGTGDKTELTRTSQRQKGDKTKGCRGTNLTLQSRTWGGCLIETQTPGHPLTLTPLQSESRQKKPENHPQKRPDNPMVV